MLRGCEPLGFKRLGLKGLMAKGSSFRVNFRVFRVEAVGFEGVGLKWKSKNPQP